MSDPLDVRLVVQITARDLELIQDFQHRDRINGRSEAVRRVIIAGLQALGIEAAQPTALEPASIGAPVLPDFDAAGRPFLGELILPWMHQRGQPTYTLGEVLTAFGETEQQHQLGRDKVITRFFKAIGWRAATSRRGGVTTRSYHAPVNNSVSP